MFVDRCLAFVLSVLLRDMDYVYPFDISKLLLTIKTKHFFKMQGESRLRCAMIMLNWTKYIVDKKKKKQAFNHNIIFSTAK